jgi:hypothetical protein
MRTALPILLALVLIVIARADTAAQTSIRIPLIIKNAAPDDGGAKNRDTLLIGVDPAATEGLDTTLGEKRLPPFPPDQIFEARLVDRTGRPAFGNGSRTDLRPYVGATQIDTFIVRYQLGAGGSPVTVTWPANLREHAGRLTIRTSAGSADMLTQTQLVIDDPDVTRITIIREGDAASGIEDASGAGYFDLEPVRNPVRRGQDLVVSYSLSRPATLSMCLVDMVGRVVARHDEGRAEAGMNTATLSLGSFATGSYVFVVSANGVMVSRRLLIVE